MAIKFCESMAAMRAITGEEGHLPPPPAEDARFLIDGPPTIMHYETIDRAG